MNKNYSTHTVNIIFSIPSGEVSTSVCLHPYTEVFEYTLRQLRNHCRHTEVDTSQLGIEKILLTLRTL